MRILLTCDPEIPVPPIQYGGVERLVDGLVTAYTKAGHEVFLLAHPESAAKNAIKIYNWPAIFSRGYKNIIRNAIQLYSVYNKTKPDIIHSFSRLLYTYPLLFNSNVPIIQTYGRKINTYSTFAAGKVGGRKMNFTAAACHMLQHLKKRKRFSVVYNFTDIDFFIPNNTVKKEHLIFLGRIEDIKGTREAIDVAINCNEKLIIAGNIQPGHDDYFNHNIKPFLSDPLIQYIGPVNDEQKKNYLQRAKALLFPIKWEEPFGIVMIEAMACGTPVIAFNRGSVPEVIKSGKNGFIVENVNEMSKAIKEIGGIDREYVRNDCVKRFSQEVIANQYLELFQTILNQ